MARRPDDSEFRELMSTFDYKPPCREHVMNFLVVAHSDVEDEMAKLFRDLDAVGICCDFWSSPGADSVYGLTAHAISSDFQMIRVVVRCCQADGQLCAWLPVAHRFSCAGHTAEVSHLTEDSLKAFDLASKVVGFTTDNEAAMRKAALEVVGDIPGANSRGCILHQIQLDVNYALELPVRM